MHHIFWRQRDGASIDVLVVRWYNRNSIRTRKKQQLQCNMWDKAFNNGLSKICRRQPLKNLKGYDMLKADHTIFEYVKVKG